jgi:ABC-type multidrug transport system fused ATPase/permease subunit
VLNNFSLSIAPGEKIALVGLSGSGKSTVAKLLARLYDPRANQIFIDNIDVRDFDLKQLRRGVCYVPQRAMLFDGTLRDNLKYGNPRATASQLHEAMRIAGLLPVVAKLPRQLDEAIGPGGGLLSGGERQRVAIARALLQRPGLLILDEATSEIDSLVEQQIFEQLHLAFPDTTMILISHRLAALVWVDRVVFLSDGQVADAGPHDQLYGRNTLYMQLHDQKACEVLEHI